MDPTFWQPTNQIGTAATVDMVFDNLPIKINFHWSVAELSVDPKTQQQLTAQVSDFLEKHPLTSLNGKNVFYLQRSGDDFVEIANPGWTSPART